ncbi:MAG TPA: hypothetical protein DGF10_03225 [Acidimicrobiaceae bacterium]|nr:hypothetical protein [Acidimicrobiaceae bacterium]
MTPADDVFPGHWSEPGPMANLDRLLEDGDLDGLLRLIDDACDNGDWESVEGVATRSRAAIERGHQLWPASDHAEHRLALSAPANFAAAAVMRDAATFTVAPLAEVAASSHTWAELDPHLPVDGGALRAIVAHERVARGDNLTGVQLDEDPLGLPLCLAPWEQTVDSPAIGPYGVDDPVPAAGILEVSLIDGQPPPAGSEAESGRRALRDLPSAWTEGSEGAATTAAVIGTGPDAAAVLAGGEVRLRQLATEEAFGLLAWLGASGGAHGRRRGAARGRFEAWWCATALAGLDESDSSVSWPTPTDQLGQAVSELGWWRWDDRARPSGWFIGLAVEDPLDGIAWGLAVRDSIDTPSSS